MRRSYLFFVTATLLTLPVSATNTRVRAQATQSNDLAVSCDADSSPGRATLKRRQPPSDGSAAGGPDQKPAEQVKCNQPEGNSADQSSVSIRFAGLHAVSESQVLFAFREERVALPTDRFPDPKATGKAAATLRKLLHAQGYMYATVHVLSDKEFKLITFQVNEGARLPLTDIRFEGGRIFSSAELAAKARECLSRLKSRDGYNQDSFEYCLRDVTNFVRSQGYLQAKFGEPQRKVAGHDLLISVPFEDGPLFRLGKVVIEGSERFSAEQLRAMLPLQQGDVAEAETISKWLFENLKKLYGDFGYIEYTAEPEPEFRTLAHRDNEGVVDFKVTIEEGQRFRVGSIKLQGVNPEENRLFETWCMRIGDVYSQSVFADCVDKLNKTGLFEPIDKDGDSDFATNDEERLVSITIKVRRRSP